MAIPSASNRYGYGSQSASDVNVAGQQSSNPYGVLDGSGLMYLSNSSDSYINAYNQEKAWARDDLIRQEGYKREDSYYDRLFDQLKRNGINPAVLLSSAGDIGAANAHSASSFKTSSYDSNAKTAEANSARMAAAIIAAIGMIIAAL